MAAKPRKRVWVRDQSVTWLAAPHENVCFHVLITQEDRCEFSVCYYGRREDLVASGAASPEMVAKGRQGERRHDREGDRMHIATLPSHVRITLYKSRDAAPSLPGVTPAHLDAAREAHRQWEADREKHKRERNARNLIETPAGCPNIDTTGATREALAEFATSMATSVIFRFLERSQNEGTEADALSCRMMRELLHAAAANPRASYWITQAISQNLTLHETVVRLRKMPRARTAVDDRKLRPRLVVDNTR
jgi:hypothetical protein